MTGDEAAGFEAFCRQWRPWLVFMLRRLGGNEPDAENAAQDALLALWKYKAAVRDPRWFLRTVGPRKLAKFWQARHEAMLVADADQCADSQVASSRYGADLVCERLMALPVREALLTLPPRQREVMAYHYDGHPNDEISRALGLRPATVRTNLYYARQNLEAAIKADGWDLHPRVLRRAHEEMQAGNLSPAGARPAIAESWTWSHDHKVNADRAALTDVPRCDDLEGRRYICPLRAICDTVGVWLGDIASRNGLIMTVSDVSGLILWRNGDHGVLRRTERDGMCEGSYWTERTVGTNANGLALRTGHPEVVVGAEHWIADHADLICAAAPVYHASDGQLLGIVNLTGRWPASHKDMLRLVDEAARQARRQLASAPGAGGNAAG